MPINPQAYGQQTIASQWAFSKAAGARGGRKSARKRRKTAAKRAAPARKRASSKRPKRLVKGSAAAKRYMASIRKRRK